MPPTTLGPRPAGPTDEPASRAPGTPDDAELRRLAVRSRQIIAEHQHASGAYPASPTFSAYCGYAWYRDGAFTAEGMSRYGDIGSVDAFHDWGARVLHARTDKVADLVARHRRGEVAPLDGMLPTRFTLTGEDGNDPWWDFQTDGYGTWLWAVVTHAERHGLDVGRWTDGIVVATDYLTAFWSVPCYDWWEEHVEHRHGSTFGAVRAGLLAAVRSGVLDADRRDRAREAAEAILATALTEAVAGDADAGGHLTKWVGTDAVDGSLAACVVPYGLTPPGSLLASATLTRIRQDLAAPGVHRFRDDVFYGGGQWPLLTCLLGWNEAVTGDVAAARERLCWVAAQADADDHLPEQVGHHLLHPQHEAEWAARWGRVASPLLWSHGMYLILADELGLLPDPEDR